MENVWLILFLSALIITLISLIFLYSKKSKIEKQPLASSVQIDGLDLHYSMRGQGPYILLIHGLGASRYVWRFIESKLEKNWTVISLDLVGFGNSSKPLNFKYDLESQTQILIKFLNILKVNNCALIGSSMGGTLALRLAQIRPDIFSKVVAISPAADPKMSLFNVNKLSIFSPFVSPLVGEKLIKQIMKRVNANPERITQESIQQYSLPYKREPNAIKSFVKSFSLLRDDTTFKNLKEIRQPVLVLWGRKDKITPLKFSHRIVGALRNSHLEIHNEAGHHIQEDDPDWTVEKISQFLDQPDYKKI